jgi:uncharacterized protein YqeY
MTLEQLKKIKIDYMKARDGQAVIGLNTAISRLMLLQIEKRAAGEELTEVDVANVLKKVEKDLTEECEAFKTAKREETVKEIERQIEVIRQYLPKMLTEDEIKNIIRELPDKSVPAVMKKFKTDYLGQCDMKMVSDVLKSLQ